MSLTPVLSDLHEPHVRFRYMTFMHNYSDQQVNNVKYVLLIFSLLFTFYVASVKILAKVSENSF